jgi:hypothetical protein
MHNAGSPSSGRPVPIRAILGTARMSFSETPDVSSPWVAYGATTFANTRLASCAAASCSAALPASCSERSTATAV